jgi:hypothetical protein
MNRSVLLATTAGLIVMGWLSLDAAQAPQEKGVISGSVSADGKPVRKSTARLRRIDTGELAGTSASDDSGIFAFVNVPAGTYVVEVTCNASVLIGTSAPIAIAPGAMIVRGVTVDVNAATASAGGAAACVAPPSKAGAFLKSAGQPFTSALGIAVVSAAAASGVAGIVSVKNDTSASR